MGPKSIKKMYPRQAFFLRVLAFLIFLVDNCICWPYLTYHRLSDDWNKVRNKMKRKNSERHPAPQTLFYCSNQNQRFSLWKCTYLCFRFCWDLLRRYWGKHLLKPSPGGLYLKTTVPPIHLLIFTLQIFQTTISSSLWRSSIQWERGCLELLHLVLNRDAIDFVFVLFCFAVLESQIQGLIQAR